MTGLAAPDGTVTLVSFTVPSTLGNERLVMEQVTAALAADDLPEAKLRRLETAVSEAAMNAIEHGNQLDPDRDVEVAVEASARSIIVKIADRGSDEPISAPLPDLEAKLAGEQSPRGWGMFLIGEMVDEVQSYRDAGRHVVELVVHKAERIAFPGSPLSVDVRRHAGTAVLDLAGDIDRTAADAMDAAYSVSASGPIVINFSGADYINSSGIAIIISLLAKARRDGRLVAAYGLTAHYEHIFSVTRLTDFMTTHRDEPAALAAAHPPEE